MSSQLEKIKRLKALADAGLVYSPNQYDIERFEEIRLLSLELMSEISGQSLTKLTDFYLTEPDYPTPKVDVRGFVLNQDNEVLLVKESIDGKWSLPGGWGDVGFTPSEVVIKEIKEETGLDAKVIRLLALYDQKCHPHPPEPLYVYKLVFYCKIMGGSIDTSFDIEEAGYFSVSELPDLSENRILGSQIRQLSGLALNLNEPVYYD